MSDEERLKVYIDEDAVRKNIIAVVAHSNETRKLQKTTEAEVVSLKNMIVSQAALIQALQGQIGMLLGRMGGGPTS